MSRSFLIITAIFFVLVLLPVAKAQAADCMVIYGGGPIDCNKPTATPTPTANPAPTKPATTKKTTALPAQTKGGLPITKPVPTKTATATGPEAFGLIGLIPAAAAGFWLRKK